MDIFNVISMIGGISLFLYGMRIMGDGLKKGSSEAMKKAMEKVTSNPFISFLLGLLVTAIIQSSTATIVLTSGLVGAGIITLHQSLGIILGANVGTTITGQIIRLLDLNSDGARWLEFFKPSTLAPIAAFAGIILIMFIKSKNSDTVGTISMGFGILFTGLLNMTAAVSGLSDSPAFANLFLQLADKPLLAYFAGAAVSFSIQSSSASIGILQALSTTGLLTFGSVYSIIIGIYLGDCVTTAVMCSIGAKADAKRTGAIHVMFNLIGAVLVFVVVTILHRTGALDGLWNKALNSGGIANMHTVFKLASALILLPVSGQLEKLSRRIVKDDPETEQRRSFELEALDKAFFNSPALALSATKNVISSLASIACNSATDALKVLDTYDQGVVDIINEDEAYIDTLTDHVSDYMVHLSPHVVPGSAGSDQLNYYIKCVSEFERIGDYAVNLTESAAELRTRETVFSPEAKEELQLMSDILSDIMRYTRMAFMQMNVAAARHIEPLEEVVDDLVADLRENHLRRLRDGKCTIYAGFIFLDVLVNLERISDQCSNVGIYTISLFDEKVNELQHDYIDQLHTGADPAYNVEYGSVRDKYFGALAAIKERHAQGQSPADNKLTADAPADAATPAQA